MNLQRLWFSLPRASRRERGTLDACVRLLCLLCAIAAFYLCAVFGAPLPSAFERHDGPHPLRVLITLQIEG